MTENARRCKLIQLLSKNSNRTSSALKSSIQALACLINGRSAYSTSSKMWVPSGSGASSWLAEFLGFAMTLAMISSLAQEATKLIDFAFKNNPFKSKLFSLRC